jgi:hypothetical protein
VVEGLSMRGGDVRGPPLAEASAVAQDGRARPMAFPLRSVPTRFRPAARNQSAGPGAVMRGNPALEVVMMAHIRVAQRV